MRHIVKDLVGVILAQHRCHQFLRHPGHQLAVLLKCFLHGSCQGSQLGFVHPGSAVIRHLPHLCLQILPFCIQSQQLCLVHTLDQYPQHIVRGFQGLAHLGDHAYFIYILGAGFFRKHIPLRHQEHTAIPMQCSINCLDGRIPCNIKMHDHTGECHQPTHCDGGQPFCFRSDRQLFIRFHISIQSTAAPVQSPFPHLCRVCGKFRSLWNLHLLYRISGNNASELQRKTV